MESLIMSIVILLSLLIGGSYLCYRLWRSGYLGRLVILGVFSCIVLEAHAKIYPKALLKQSYERIILGMDATTEI
jgi:hypothetical protein